MQDGFSLARELCPSYPPKPRLALSIGIIGHRPVGLMESGREHVPREIARVLDLILAKVAANHRQELSREIFDDAEPALTIVSELAEGTDRMAAQAGMARRMKLAAVLPFSPSEYARDFPSDTSKAEFNDLLVTAHAVLALPGDRQNAPKSYEAAGLTLIDQSDLVIAVWDGGAPRGLGGTAALVDAAARFLVPVIHVDAKGADKTLLRWAGLDPFPSNAGALADVPKSEFDDATAATLVDRLLQVPTVQITDVAKGAPVTSKVEQEALAGYLNRGFYRLNRGFSFAALQTTLCVKGMGRRDFRLERPADVSATCANSFSALGIAAAAAPAAKAYGFADAIAVRHAHMFRSSYVSNFVLAAAAVSCAALSIVFPEAKKVLTAFEVFLLALLVIKTLIGTRLNWHRSWLEAREVAERLRAALPLWTLGARPASYHGDESTWTGWYVRSVLRELGMRQGTLDRAGTALARTLLKSVVVDQADYHKNTAKRMERLEHRMEWFGLVLLGLTFLLGLGYLAHYYFIGPVPKEWGLIVAALSAAFPAIASASYGIRVIGEFDGVKQRSQRTERELRKLIAALDSDETAAPTDVVRLRARAQAVSDVLLGDVAQWRVAAESRGLAIPG